MLMKGQVRSVYFDRVFCNLVICFLLHCIYFASEFEFRTNLFSFHQFFCYLATESMKFDGLVGQYYEIKKQIKPKWRNHFKKKKICIKQLYVSLLFSIVLFSFLCLHSLSPLSWNMGFFFSVTTTFLDLNNTTTTTGIIAKLVKTKTDEDTCLGRYIYIHNLPARFNKDVLKNCLSLNRKGDKSNMCDNIQNYGFGLKIDGSLSKSWYSTKQFLLELIFRNRMKKYDCLTNNSSISSMVFVPFYSGLDLRPHLWGFNSSVRDSSGIALMNWLTEKPEWRRMHGKDHFLVSGRISNDFFRRRKKNKKSSDWGSGFRLLPESESMFMLSIETSKSFKHDYAIPYPTYFHPSKRTEITKWQQDILRKQNNRIHLFSFIGASRSNRKGSIREEVIKQCKLASDHNRTCRFLDCASSSSSTSTLFSRKQSCDDIVTVMKLLRSSVFCLQPPGDSFTRRSTFDSILAGSIPVFFHLGSAYNQYIWHLPKNYTEYSVYISEKELKNGNFSIEQRLLEITDDKVAALREEVVGIIPRIIYVDPRSRFGDVFEDAFDIAVKSVLEKVDGTKQGRYTG